MIFFFLSRNFAPSAVEIKWSCENARLRKCELRQVRQDSLPQRHREHGVIKKYTKILSVTRQESKS